MLVRVLALDREQRRNMFLSTWFCQYFIASANAIELIKLKEDRQLYNNTTTNFLSTGFLWKY